MRHSNINTSVINRILATGAAWVDNTAAPYLIQSALLAGITLCVGYFDPDTDRVVLYHAA